MCYPTPMLPTLPSDDILYRALVERDASYEGHAYVGVTSTGVFCRLSCTARKPKPENCLFYPSLADCIDAGFRPCLRCRPLEPLGRADPIVAELMHALEAEPGRRWLESDIVARGLDPSTVRRQFRRHLGITFLDLARRYRLKQAANTLAQGGSVIEAQLDAGFESASGFRAAFARLLGRAPSEASAASLLVADWIASPLGPLLAVADRTSLHLLEFFDRKALPTELRRLEAGAKLRIGIGRSAVTDQIEAELERYFAGTLRSFSTPLALNASAFTRSVWAALRGIPTGETRSYREIATAIGRQASVRAVARANGANQLAIVIPCHRVIGSDGDLTGYGGGLWRKRWLLDHERSVASGVRVGVAA